MLVVRSWHFRKCKMYAFVVTVVLSCSLLCGQGGCWTTYWTEVALLLLAVLESQPGTCCVLRCDLCCSRDAVLVVAWHAYVLTCASSDPGHFVDFRLSN